MPKTPILIVGAGPTGLVLALCLTRLGVPYRLIDRASGPGEASRAIVVQARTLELYRRLGIAEAVVERGMRLGEVEVREAGREVARLSLEDAGAGLSRYPFALIFPQDDHERFLVERLGSLGSAVEWETELLSFRQGEAGVRAVLRHGGAATEVAAEYLCGCDGAHSRVRDGLGLGFPGGTYSQPFYVADVRIAGGFRTAMSVSLEPQGLGLLFPVRPNGMQRLVGLVPEAAAGLPQLDFAAIRPAVEAQLGIRVEQVNWFSTYHVHHRVAGQFRLGRCFLAGDAGHIHSPAGGQGMNTGIGDAVNLGWKLAAVLRGEAGPAILDSYEQERIGFARSLVGTTDRAFTGMVSPGLGGRFLRDWLVPHVLPLLAGFGPARRAFFQVIGQLRIAYPGSALSEGAVGSVAAGDRLPWVAPASGVGEDDVGGGLRWQLDVFGNVAGALAAAAAGLGLTVAARPWDAAAERAGLRQDAAYLVRPDGHVALAWADQEPQRLRDYAARHGLVFGPTAHP